MQLSWKTRHRGKSKCFPQRQSNFLKDIRFVFNKQLLQIVECDSLPWLSFPVHQRHLGSALLGSRSAGLHFAYLGFFFFLLNVLSKISVQTWFGRFTVLQAIICVNHEQRSQLQNNGFQRLHSLYQLLMTISLNSSPRVVTSTLASGVLWRMPECFTKAVALYRGSGPLLHCFIPQK